jgi:hypothetical protein
MFVNKKKDTVSQKNWKSTYEIRVSALTYRNTIMVLLSVSFTLSAAEKRSITIEDALKFRSLRSPSISNDGKWVAYSEELDRGDVGQL